MQDPLNTTDFNSTKNAYSQSAYGSSFDPNLGEKSNFDFLKEFAEKLAINFESFDLNNLTPQQRAIVEKMPHKLKQILAEIVYLQKLHKENIEDPEELAKQEKREERLEEIAKDLFVVACASTIDMKEVLEFKAQILNRFVIEERSLMNDERPILEGLNALRAALAAGRNFDDLQLLINEGANPNFKNKDGENIAHFIVELGLSKEYLDFAVTVGVDINLKNIHGDTPLDLAMRAGREDLAQTLIARGGKSGKIGVDLQQQAEAGAKTKTHLQEQLERANSKETSQGVELDDAESMVRKRAEAIKALKERKANPDLAARKRMLDEMQRSSASQREAQDSLRMSQLLEEDEKTQAKKREKTAKEQEDFGNFFQTKTPTAAPVNPMPAEKSQEFQSTKQDQQIAAIEQLVGKKIEEINLNELLFDAVASGNANLAMLLLRMGADSDYQEGGISVLELAVILGASRSLIGSLSISANSDTLKSAAEAVVGAFGESLQELFGIETIAQKTQKELELAELKQKTLAEIKGDSYSSHLEDIAQLRVENEKGDTKKAEEKEYHEERQSEESQFGIIDMLKVGFEKLANLADPVMEHSDGEINIVQSLQEEVEIKSQTQQVLEKLDAESFMELIDSAAEISNKSTALAAAFDEKQKIEEAQRLSQSASNNAAENHAVFAVNSETVAANNVANTEAVVTSDPIPTPNSSYDDLEKANSTDIFQTLSDIGSAVMKVIDVAASIGVFIVAENDLTASAFKDKEEGMGIVRSQEEIAKSFTAENSVRETLEAETTEKTTSDLEYSAKKLKSEEESAPTEEKEPEHQYEKESDISDELFGALSNGITDVIEGAASGMGRAIGQIKEEVQIFASSSKNDGQDDSFEKNQEMLRQQLSLMAVGEEEKRRRMEREGKEQNASIFDTLDLGDENGEPSKSPRGLGAEVVEKQLDTGHALPPLPDWVKPISSSGA
jgi:ankyrin repeat protein